MLKYALIVGIVYVMYRYNTWKSQLGSAKRKENDILDDLDNEDDYIDYEEVD